MWAIHTWRGSGGGGAWCLTRAKKNQVRCTTTPLTHGVRFEHIVKQPSRGEARPGTLPLRQAPWSSYGRLVRATQTRRASDRK